MFRSALFWTIVGSVAGVLALIVAIAQYSASISPPDRPAQSTATPTYTPDPGASTSSREPQNASSRVQPSSASPRPPDEEFEATLERDEAIDLDNRRISNKNAEGVDLNRIRTDWVSGKLHPTTRDISLTTCTDILTKTQPDSPVASHLRKGDSFCLLTSDNNVAGLVVTTDVLEGHMPVNFTVKLWHA